MDSVVVAAIVDSDGREQTAAEVRRDAFSPNVLDDVLPELMKAARSSLLVPADADLGPFSVEIAIRLSSETATRPSLHVSRETIAMLARAGASLDYDPYC